MVLKRSKSAPKAGEFQSKGATGMMPGASGSGRLESELESWLGAERPMFGELALGMGAIDAERLTNALALQREQGGKIGEVLGLEEQTITAILSTQFAIQVADLRNEEPQKEALDRVGEELARHYHVLPLRIDEENRTWIVTNDPRDDEAIRTLTVRCGRIGLLLGNRSDIEKLLHSAYSVLKDAQVFVQAHQLTETKSPQQLADEPTARVDENAPVVQVVNRIVTQAVRQRASDVHIEAQTSGIRVRYRVDGVLNEVLNLPSSMGAAISSRIKVMAELNIVEKRRPQDGQFGFEVDGRPIDVRTSVVATVHGEKIVLRILDKQRSLIGLRDLGMPEQFIADYSKIVKAPLGMLLVTGPTGSGKTTTLYATLAEMNDPTKNVVTVEDPVEYQFDGINQMQISESAGISFADGLRGILRQDPDTILVGEIRDIETARIAMQAALTGHFVLSSLHAVDAIAAVHRFTDMGIEPFLVASAVSGVVGQRLLRRNCPSCSVPEKPSSDRVRLVAAQLGTAKANFRRGEGCASCGFTGYRGRVGVYELLTMSDRLRHMVVDRATHSEMRKVAVNEGMVTMQTQAFQMVANGQTTIEEVLRAVYAPGVELGGDAFGELMPGKGQIEATSGADSTAQPVLSVGAGQQRQAFIADGEGYIDSADAAPNAGAAEPEPSPVAAATFDGGLG